MVKTTRQQREAIKQLYDIDTLFFSEQGDQPMCSSRQFNGDEQPMTYREFRRQVHSTLGRDGAVAVPWCGMWLCIERDGYTYS